MGVGSGFYMYLRKINSTLNAQYWVCSEIRSECFEVLLCVLLSNP